MQQLNEGLRRGDLEDLVLPLISVDEYVSKVSDDAIVFGFYVNEKGAAEDLNRFIQRSPLDILDTDISGSPDQRGYYMVFVELLNNQYIGETFDNLLKDVTELTSIESWQMHVRDYEHLIPFTVNALNRALDQEEVEESTENEDDSGDEDNKVSESAIKVLDYLTQSDLRDASLDGDVLSISGSRSSSYFVFEGMVSTSDLETVIETHASPDMSLENIARLNRITRMLGEGWIANPVGSLDGIQRIDDERVILLRPLV